jgi:hypothetical protein
MTFQTPGSSVYSGYLVFKAPTDIPAASVQEMSLLVNFRGTASRQTWTWSVYDWSAQQWVKLGSASGMQKKWNSLKFNMPMLRQYASSQGEFRVQLRSNNARGDAKIDYEVIQLTFGSAASAQTIILPTATMAPTNVMPSPMPTQVTPTPTATATATSTQVVPTESETPTVSP